MPAVMAPDDDDYFRRERADRVLASGRISRPTDIDDLLTLSTPGVLPVLANALRHRAALVRSRAAAAMSRFDDSGFTTLLAAVQSGPIHQRQAAAEALGNWGDQQATPYLIAALDNAQQEAQAAIVRNVLLGYFFMAIMIFVWLFAALRNEAQGSVSSESYRITLIDALGKLGDIRAIPILARLTARMNSHARVSVWAQNALLRLLPGIFHLLPEQADVLGPNGVSAITALLSHRNTVVVEYAMDALRAVGDGRAIPSLRNIANGRDANLAQKARFLLPVLEERARAEAARMTLLRGSSTPSAGPHSNELLRAAQAHTAPHQPEQLLRAAISPEGIPND